MAKRTKSKMTMALLRDKVDECYFFLRLMEESKGNDVNFGHFMSAFLCSFASIFDRLEHLLGEKEVGRLLRSNQDWKRLKELRHGEVHREGVVYYRVPTIRTNPRRPERSKLGPRFSTREGRFHLTWDKEDFTYQFHDHPGDVLRLCSECVSGIDALLPTIESHSRRKEESLLRQGTASAVPIASAKESGFSR